MRDSKRDEAIERCDTDLHFSHLPVEFTSHEAFAEEFNAAHFGLDTGPSMITAPAFPYRPSKALAGVQGLVPDNAPSVSGFHGRAVLRGGMIVFAPVIRGVWVARRRRIAVACAGGINSPDLRRFLVDCAV